MKSLTAILWVITLQAFCTAVHAVAPEPGAAEGSANSEEQELLAAFRPLTQIAGPLGMMFSTVVVVDADASDSPLQMAYAAGVCRLVIQVRGNPTYRQMLDTGGRYSRATMLRAVLAHEMGHCYRDYFRASAHPAPATASFKGTSPAPRGHPIENEHDNELCADLFALAWTAAYNPEEFDDVYAFLREMRFTLLPADTTGRYASPEELAAGLKLRPAGTPLDPRVLPRLALLFLD